jgi:hypothetical protein
MAFSGSGTHGTLNGTTPVEIVPTPSAGVERFVRAMYFYNNTGGAVALAISKYVGGTDYEICVVTLNAGDTLQFGDGDHVILTNGETLRAVLASSPAVNPDFVVSWGDDT